MALKATQKYVHKDALDMVNFYLVMFILALEEVADSSTEYLSYVVQDAILAAFIKFIEASTESIHKAVKEAKQ